MACSTISMEAFKQRRMQPEPVTILDVREVEEYRAGHVEGSILIPLGILPYRIDQLNSDDEIIVVCRSGNRSLDACNLLRKHGFRRVVSLAGGLSSWKR
jgi:rhodanese-related sulfurtransferase